MSINYADLKSPEEVKEYLKNLHIEYTFGCCSEKKPEVCHLLGDYEEGVNTDFKKSAEIYKNNCDNLDFGRSCAKFGGYLFYGKAVDMDKELAYDYFKKACEQKDGVGCANYGFLSTASDFNEGRPDKLERFNAGIEALEQGCYEFRQDKACFTLGGLFLKGVADMLERNPKEGYRAMLQSCEFANPYACANISQMHSRGDGAEKNDELAKLFKDRALDLYNQLTGVGTSVKFGAGTG